MMRGVSTAAVGGRPRVAAFSGARGGLVRPQAPAASTPLCGAAGEWRGPLPLVHAAGLKNKSLPANRKKKKKRGHQSKHIERYTYVPGQEGGGDDQDVVRRRRPTGRGGRQTPREQANQQIQQELHRALGKLRVNEAITAPRVRVVDASGKMAGVFTIAEARAMAKEAGLDLVQVHTRKQQKRDPSAADYDDADGGSESDSSGSGSTDAEAGGDGGPDSVKQAPLVKLLDFAAQRESVRAAIEARVAPWAKRGDKSARAAATKPQVTKTMRFTAVTAPHDLETKGRKIVQLLEKGHPVKVQISSTAAYKADEEEPVRRDVLRKIVGFVGASGVVEAFTIKTVGSGLQARIAPLTSKGRTAKTRKAGEEGAAGGDGGESDTVAANAPALAVLAQPVLWRPAGAPAPSAAAVPLPPDIAQAVEADLSKSERVKEGKDAPPVRRGVAGDADAADAPSGSYGGGSLRSKAHRKLKAKDRTLSLALEKDLEDVMVDVEDVRHDVTVGGGHEHRLHRAHRGVGEAVKEAAVADLLDEDEFAASDAGLDSGPDAAFSEASEESDGARR